MSIVTVAAFEIFGEIAAVWGKYARQKNSGGLCNRMARAAMGSGLFGKRCDH
jgi:hypothetical protein